MGKDFDLLKDNAIAKYKEKDYRGALIEFEKLKNEYSESFEKSCIFYYLWTLLFVKVRIKDEEIESNYISFKETVMYILKRVNKGDMLQNLTVMTVVEYLDRKKNYSPQDLDIWLNKIDPSTLNTKSINFKDKNGKNLSMPSQMEEWFSIKTKTLEKMGNYQECSNFCDLALNQIPEFHNNNDIWFKRRKALSLSKLGITDEPINILKDVLNKKNDWFIQKDIGDIYFKIGKIEEANEYYIDAALNNGPSEMKIGLFWNLAEVLEQQNKVKESNLHKKFVIDLRNAKGWKLSSKELEFQIKNTNQSNKVFDEKKDIKNLRNIWESIKWDTKHKVEGNIDVLLPNGQSGFIVSEKKRYYFSSKDFKGKKESLQKGNKVSFFIGKGFDKKKNTESEIAINIKLM